MTGANELAIRAKEDAGAMEQLRRQYHPMLAARVMLHMGFWRPEYMESAQLAVEEAVASYISEKGSFTAHLKQVLKFRLIDLRRREKVDTVVPTGSLSEAQQAMAVSAASIAAYREEQETALRREEIELFRADLEDLGISMEELVSSSPRHAATRKACRRACRHMLLNRALLDKARSGRVPVKELSEALGVSAKTFERHRKYLVGCAIALAGEYRCITEYILSREGEA